MFESLRLDVRPGQTSDPKLLLVNYEMQVDGRKYAGSWYLWRDFMESDFTRIMQLIQREVLELYKNKQ